MPKTSVFEVMPEADELLKEEAALRLLVQATPQAKSPELPALAGDALQVSSSSESLPPEAKQAEANLVERLARMSLWQEAPANHPPSPALPATKMIPESAEPGQAVAVASEPTPAMDVQDGPLSPKEDEPSEITAALPATSKLATEDQIGVGNPAQEEPSETAANLPATSKPAPEDQIGEALPDQCMPSQAIGNSAEDEPSQTAASLLAASKPAPEDQIGEALPEPCMPSQVSLGNPAEDEPSGTAAYPLATAPLNQNPELVQCPAPPSLAAAPQDADDDSLTDATKFYELQADKPECWDKVPISSKATQRKADEKQAANKTSKGKEKPAAAAKKRGRPAKQTKTAPDTAAEVVAESESEGAQHGQAEASVAPTAERKAAAKSRAKAAAEAKGKAGAEAAPKEKAKAGAKAAAKTKEKAGADAAPDTKAKAGAKAAPDTKAKAGAKAVLDTKAKAGAKAAPKTKSKAGGSDDTNVEEKPKKDRPEQKPQRARKNKKQEDEAAEEPVAKRGRHAAPDTGEANEGQLNSAGKKRGRSPATKKKLSRKSSAYHCAMADCKKRGVPEEEAKKIARKAGRPYPCGQ